MVNTQDTDSSETDSVTVPGHPAVLAFKTQLAAVAYLQSQGFKIKKSKFNTDAKKGQLIPRNKDGHFEAPALLGYAQHLQTLAKAEHSGQVNASASKIAADARLRDIQAARQELKLQREQGLIMPKAQHEAELSARALFFRAELEGFGPRVLARLIHLVGGREDSLQDALLLWAEQIADLMNAWAEDREFAVGDEDELPEGDGFGGDDFPDATSQEE